MKIIYLFKESYNEMKKTNSIVLAGLFIAIGIVIDRFSIHIGQIAKITFGFIVTASSSMIFGPFYSSILAGLINLINHFIFSTGDFFWGWTLNPMLAGIIYGIFLYRKGFDVNNKISLFKRILISKFLVTIFVNIILGTYWISITSGKAFIPYMALRSFKELVIFPIQIIILFYILNSLKKLK